VHPRKYYRNNVVNSLNLLEAMLDADVRTIVFSSSCAIYGGPDRVPIGEDQQQLPVNPYKETKLAVEGAAGKDSEICLALRLAAARPCCWTATSSPRASGEQPQRPVNPYGETKLGRTAGTSSMSEGSAPNFK